MKYQELDLIRNGFDELIGKKLVINNTTYITQQIVGEGAEKIVVALKNTNTNLIHFVVRIYKLKQGTDNYKSAKISAIKSSNIHYFDNLKSSDIQNKDSHKGSNKDFNSMDLIDIANGLDINMGNIILSNKSKQKDSVLKLLDNFQVYEIGGGLMQFQHNFSINQFDENQHDKISLAHKLFDQNKMNELKILLKNILSENPNHVDAIFFEGAIECQEGLWVSGYNKFIKILKLEPNSDITYINIVNVLVHIGKIEQSFKILEYGLSLLSKNMLLYEKIMWLINKYDLMERFSGYYNDYVELLDPNYANYLMVQYKSSLKRFISLREHFDAALELQVRENKWDSAIKELNLGLSVSNRYYLCMNNIAVCNFHLENYEETLEILEREIITANNPEIVDSMNLLIALSYFGLNEYDECIKWFYYINDNAREIVDLPSIPIAFVLVDNGMACIQEKNTLRIIKCIEVLKEEPIVDNEKLSTLIANYQKLNNIFLDKL